MPALPRKKACRGDGFYPRFLARGELGFDIGAHGGDRTACWRRIGARVVAVEPQPALSRLLRILFSHDPGLVRVQSLIGSEIGRARLLLNSANLTVATASTSFVAAAAGAPGWRDEVWECGGRVSHHAGCAGGRLWPAGFHQARHRGFEFQALTGLGTPPRSLSFEFTTIQRDVATASLTRAGELGYRAFNAVLGETTDFVHPAPLDISAMAEWFCALPAEANSGDVHASMDPGRLQR